MRCEAVASIYQVDPEELREAAQRKLDGTATLDGTRLRSEEEFRRQEYEAFRTGRGGDTTDLMVEVRDPAPYGPDLTGVFDSVCLVRKLRETRVSGRLLQASASADLLPIAEDDTLRWLGDCAERLALHSRVNSTKAFQEVHLLLDAGLDPSIRAINAQVPD